MVADDLICFGTLLVHSRFQWSKAKPETEAAQQLKTAYRNFVGEAEPERKNEAWRDLIRAIFGKDSLAEDTVF
jgi:hypothetical protein